MIRFLFALCLLVFAGCQSLHTPAANPGGQFLTGQMHYASTKRSFVGDFTARISQSDFQFDVTKGPGVPLLSLRESGDTYVHFEGAGHSWTGNPKIFTPGKLKSWLALHDVLLGRARADVRVTRQGEQLIADFPQTGERFAFQFSR